MHVHHSIRSTNAPLCTTAKHQEEAWATDTKCYVGDVQHRVHMVNCRTSAWPRKADMYRQFSRFAVGIHMSAPAISSARATEAWPASHAANSGVAPLLLLQSTLAPSSSNVRASEASPTKADTCSAVWREGTEDAAAARAAMDSDADVSCAAAATVASGSVQRSHTWSPLLGCNSRGAQCSIP